MRNTSQSTAGPFAQLHDVAFQRIKWISVPIETPTTRVASARQAFKLPDTLFWIVTTREILAIVTDKLIEALSKRLRLLACTTDEFVVNGQRNLHKRQFSTAHPSLRH